MAASPQTSHIASSPPPRSAINQSHADAPAPSSSEDADSLPAVGKVYEGPKRSMSAIFAEKMKAAAAAPVAAPAPVAAGGGRGPSSVAVAPSDPSDLAVVWRQLLDAAAELGSGVAVPLASGQLLRIDNDQAVIQFSHAMAGLAHVVQFKHDALRDKLQAILDRPISLHILTEDAPATPPAAPAGANHQARPRPADNAPAAPLPPLPVSGPPQDTPEIRRQVAQDPIVRGVMDTLGGTILRVEQTDV